MYIYTAYISCIFMFWYSPKVNFLNLEPSCQYKSVTKERELMIVKKTSTKINLYISHDYIKLFETRADFRCT